MTDAIQDRYAPHTTCFGCGPSNADGLRIKTVIEDGVGVCEFHPARHHQAFDGFVNGGIIGVVFDCHCNWTAAWYLMDRAGAARILFRLGKWCGRASVHGDREAGGPVPGTDALGPAGGVPSARHGRIGTTRDGGGHRRSGR